jgi:hypothetical protein
MGRYDFFCGGPCPHCNSKNISSSCEIQTKCFPYPSFKSYYPGDKLPILIDQNQYLEFIGDTSCCNNYISAVFESRSDGFTYLLKYVKYE